MRARARSREERAAGFTLVEILAALALAASIIAGLAALVHHVALEFDRGARGVNDAERFALAMDRLARDFGAASFPTQVEEKATPQQRAAPALANKPKDPQKDKPPPALFEGGATRIVFVSASAVGAGAAREEVLTLSVESLQDDTTQLVRRRSAWLGPRAGLFAREAQDAVVLMKGRYDISFSFARLGAEGGLTWTSSWKGETELPRLVRVNVQDAESGASLVAGAEFVLRVDAPPACAQAASGCLPGQKKNEPQDKKDAPPPPREPT